MPHHPIALPACLAIAALCAGCAAPPGDMGGRGGGADAAAPVSLRIMRIADTATARLPPAAPRLPPQQLLRLGVSQIEASTGCIVLRAITTAAGDEVSAAVACGAGAPVNI